MNSVCARLAKTNNNKKRVRKRRTAEQKTTATTTTEQNQTDDKQQPLSMSSSSSVVTTTDSTCVMWMVDVCYFFFFNFLVFICFFGCGLSRCLSPVCIALIYCHAMSVVVVLVSLYGRIALIVVVLALDCAISLYWPRASIILFIELNLMDVVLYGECTTCVSMRARAPERNLCLLAGRCCFDRSGQPIDRSVQRLGMPTMSHAVFRQAKSPKKTNTAKCREWDRQIDRTDNIMCVVCASCVWCLLAKRSAKQSSARHSA